MAEKDFLFEKFLNLKLKYLYVAVIGARSYLTKWDNTMILKAFNNHDVNLHEI